MEKLINFLSHSSNFWSCAIALVLFSINLQQWAFPPSFHPKKERNPASVLAGSFLDDYKPSSETIVFECLDVKQIKTPVAHIRIRFENCPPELTIQSITNQNNSYTATIFLSNANYSTDYMSLERGTNEIKIASKDHGEISFNINFIE